jgi:hypothetical protein
MFGVVTIETLLVLKDNDCDYFFYEETAVESIIRVFTVRNLLTRASIMSLVDKGTRHRQD